MPSPCPHCGAIGACEWQDDDCLNVPTHEHRRPLTGTHLCDPCIQRINTRLTQILELYATLPFVTQIGSVPDDVAPHRHVKGDSAPAPMRLTVTALLDGRNRCTGHYTTDVPDVAGVLDEWARCLADRLHLTGTSLDGTLFRSVRFLQAFEELAAAAPWVDDYQAEIDWIWGKLRDAHGLTPPDMRPVGRCPSLNGAGATCGGPLWPDKAGAMQVACGRCQRVFGERFLQHLGGMIGDTA
jgi:hypothetical protein